MEQYISRCFHMILESFWGVVVEVVLANMFGDDGEHSTFPRTCRWALSSQLSSIFNRHSFSYFIRALILVITLYTRNTLFFNVSLIRDVKTRERQFQDKQNPGDRHCDWGRYQRRTDHPEGAELVCIASSTTSDQANLRNCCLVADYPTFQYRAPQTPARCHTKAQASKQACERDPGAAGHCKADWSPAASDRHKDSVDGCAYCLESRTCHHHSRGVWWQDWLRFFRTEDCKTKNPRQCQI